MNNQKVSLYSSKPSTLETYLLKLTWKMLMVLTLPCLVNARHGTNVIVGALQYMTLTQPNISFSVNKSYQFMANPLDSYWSFVKSILWYLICTTHHGLLLQPVDPASNMSFIAYSNSDWASDPDDMKSTSGSYVYLVPNLVLWSSKN